MLYLKHLETIEKISSECISLLDLVHANNYAVNRFNDSIDLLRSVLMDDPEFADQYAKLLTYQTAFNFAAESKNNLLVAAAQPHIIDIWRIVLLEINSSAQKTINIFLRNRLTTMGKYINVLQNAFARRNRALLYLRTEIKTLKRALKNAIEDDVHDYEVVNQNGLLGFGKYLSNWF